MLVFISHLRQNSSTALKLTDELNRRGVETWLDARDLETGANWREQVTEAIQKSSGFIFVIGPPDSSDSHQRFEWQKVAETEYYLDPEKPFIPLVIGGAEVPGFLSSRQVIPVDVGHSDFEEIGNAVMALLEQPRDTIDPEKLHRGREARTRALANLKEYSLSLEQEDVKRAGLRALT